MTNRQHQPGYQELLRENEQLRGQLEDLKERLAELERQIEELSRADRLRLRGDFDGALKILDELPASDWVSAFREKVIGERREVAIKAYAEGRKMMRESRVAEGIGLFESVPAHIIDTREDVRAARELRARVAARIRSRAKTDLLLIVIAAIAVAVGIAVAVFR